MLTGGLVPESCCELIGLGDTSPLSVSGIEAPKCTESLVYSMCVVSQGGALSGGRKGSKVYWYPLQRAQGWLNKEPEFGRSKGELSSPRGLGI